MIRHQFLTGCLSAAVTLARGAPAPGEEYPVGDFILNHHEDQLRLSSKTNPEGVLWESARNFLVAETVIADIETLGVARSCPGRARIAASYGHVTIGAIDTTENRITISGKLAGKTGSVDFSLIFEALSDSHLRFVINARSERINRISLRIASTPDEVFFDFGRTLRVFNQPAARLGPEHGVGCNRPAVTQILGAVANRGGGNPLITASSAPNFISGRPRSLFLENREYGTFDLRVENQVEIKVWSGTMTGFILYGEAALDQIAYANFSKQMRVLPDRIDGGLVEPLYRTEAKAGRVRQADAAREVEAPVAG